MRYNLANLMIPFSGEKANEDRDTNWRLRHCSPGPHPTAEGYFSERPNMTCVSLRVSILWAE